MSRNAFPSCWPALAGIFALSLASCNGTPARVVELSGEPAVKLAAFDPAAPVLVARAADSVVAVVFSEDEGNIDSLRKSLEVADVPACGNGGWFGRKGWIGREGAVACCDPQTNTFVLNTKTKWLRTGEHCEPRDPRERAVDDESDDGFAYDDPELEGVPFVSVEPELSQILKDMFGIDYRFMQLAQIDGSSRALVNGPAPGKELALVPPVLDRSGIEGGPQTILASHKVDSPEGCISRVRKCDESDGDRCRRRYKHWYYLDDFTRTWCEMASECRC
jgi:hypothetical protein